jgi:ribosomal protein L24E
MSDDLRYDKLKASGKPRTCKFCGESIWGDRIGGTYVNPDDQQRHQCPRKVEHFHSRAMVNAEARRHNR